VSVYEQIIAAQFSGPVPWGTRAKGADLMQLISVEQVINQLDEFIVSGATDKNSKISLENKAG
jgi:heptosyltransferase I